MRRPSSLFLSSAYFDEEFAPEQRTNKKEKGWPCLD